MASNLKIAFIGGGNMTQAIVEGLVKKQYPSQNIIVSNRSIEKIKKLQDNFNIRTTEDNIQALQNADVIILAVKPQVLAELAEQIKNHIQENQLVVSIAAGVKHERLMQYFGKDKSIIRAMPNLPVAINQGVTGLFAKQDLSGHEKKQIDDVFNLLGSTLWLSDESLISVVAAISGSGPALVFYMIEAFQKAGETLGLSEEDAKRLALQTFLGASDMASTSEFDVVTLRKQVTSPNGTTEQAIAVLNKEEVKQHIVDAAKAAIKRSKELSETL